MNDQVQCPKCGSRLRRGSTFCINCGSKISLDLEPLKEVAENELPSLEESILEEIKEPISSELPSPKVREEILEPIEELSWDDEQPKLSQESAPKTMVSIEPAQLVASEKKEVETSVIEDTSSLSWEEGIKEGMPFKEIEPPRIVSDAEDITISTDDALTHLFPEVKDDATREAVTHLFPGGRGSTNPSFIDVVVGKPSRISVKIPLSELEHPSCPNCGMTITSDGFEYPPYVFDAMGKARSDHADKLLKENEHEKAIEYYEMAKMLFEKSGNEKNIAEVTRRIDLGYDAMAQYHYDEAEVLLKEGNFEWAVVQFKKARELYMFTTDSKKRARCAERAREAYVEWGKNLELEGDQLAKESKTRDALSKYQESAGKFREGGDTKRLRGLDKKIRKA